MRGIPRAFTNHLLKEPFDSLPEDPTFPSRKWRAVTPRPSRAILPKCGRTLDLECAKVGEQAVLGSHVRQHRWVHFVS